MAIICVCRCRICVGPFVGCFYITASCARVPFSVLHIIIMLRHFLGLVAYVARAWHTTFFLALMCVLAILGAWPGCRPGRINLERFLCLISSCQVCISCGETPSRPRSLRRTSQFQEANRSEYVHIYTYHHLKITADIGWIFIVTRSLWASVARRFDLLCRFWPVRWIQDDCVRAAKSTAKRITGPCHQRWGCHNWSHSVP